MLYTNNHVQLLRDNFDNVKKDLEKIKNNILSPNMEERKVIHNIIINYCSEQKRKIYGGYAWHLLIQNKNPNDGLYSTDKIPDIDIYSPEPLTDWFNLCNLLFDAGFENVQGEEALHPETYTIKINRILFCDITYVPKNIYARMPFQSIKGLNCIDPKFIAIDYFRILSDPISSLFRFFDCSEELKTFTRYVKLQSYYNFPYNDRPYIVEKILPDKQLVLNDVYEFIKNKTSIVVIGFYAYNYFRSSSGFNYVPIPYFEFISIDYKKDVLELLDLLNKHNVNHKEFYPFFQFTDYSTEIYLGESLVCRIFGNNKKSVPYLELPARNFYTNKESKKFIRFGSWAISLLYLLIGAYKAYVAQNKTLQQSIYHLISHCLIARDTFLTTIKKTILDDTIFSEYVYNCIGDTITVEKERMILIEKRKKNKEPAIYRYEPKDGKKDPPKFLGFKNTSGNQIVNTKYLQLVEHVDTTDSESVVSKDDISIHEGSGI